ncbi:MAG: Maf family protein, partial [Sphingomonadales bacterium]
MRLALASSSPRRRDLLARIGVTPARIASPDIDAPPLKGEIPRVYALRLAEQKARAVAREADEIVLAGDTTVAVGRRILPQASDAA